MTTVPADGHNPQSDPLGTSRIGESLTRGTLPLPGTRQMPEPPELVCERSSRAHLPPMNDMSRAQRSVDWQNRNLVPWLLLVAVGVLVLAWLAGGIEWWLAIPLIVFGVGAYVGVKRRNDTT